MPIDSRLYGTLLSLFIAIALSGCSGSPSSESSSYSETPRIALAPVRSERAAHGVRAIATTKPIVLFWTNEPQELTNITHLTPSIWIREQGTEFKTGSHGWNNRYTEQGYLLERGIIPLKWCGGVTYGSWSEKELTEYWCSMWQEGFVGIAIDEFVGWGQSGDTKAKMGRALVNARKKCPDLFIAVWHGGPLTEQLADAYRIAVDLVLLEAYCPGNFLIPLVFGYNLAVARRTGIIQKSIFAVGINDADERVRDRPWDQWANTPAKLERQMRWIRENAPEMPGIAFFSSGASLKMMKVADRLAGEIFR